MENRGLSTAGLHAGAHQATQQLKTGVATKVVPETLAPYEPASEILKTQLWTGSWGPAVGNPAVWPWAWTRRSAEVPSHLSLSVSV